MNYDIIGGEQILESVEFMTIGELIHLAESHPDKGFRFLGTEYTVGNLHSWRGSYDIPAIEYEWDKGALALGAEIAMKLQDSVRVRHYGYKGGEYYFSKGDVFYVSEYGRASEFKVVGFDVVGTEVILNTKLDPY